MSEQTYQVIIGLEVHVQLKTESKLFCRCSTDFGQPPNTQTCPVCIGMPGSLPVMNEKAFRMAVKTAIALNCEIPEFTKWDRKNYYYPDLPKGYQISQFDLPMSCNGWLQIESDDGEFETKKVGITRAHLEEDAGKSMHDEVAGKADSSIDLNRTGTPLLEIVSEPDMRSAAEAKAYLTDLKLLLTYLDVSDCNMQEGSLRVDANVNLHIETPEGTIATPIVEIKNMNSFRAVERALIYESQRQYEVWQETGQQLGEVPKQTRGWDDQAEITRGQRHKEESSDYRYFPDPDLVPVKVSSAEVDSLRSEIGELPAAIRLRLVEEHGISDYTSNVLVNQGRGVVDYFVAVAEATGNGKTAGNWVQQDVLRTLKEKEIQIEQFPVTTSELAELLTIIERGELDNSRGKEVFTEMIETGKPAAQVMQEKGIESVDENQVIELCRSLLEQNPQVVSDVLGGKQQAVGSLIGQAKQQNPNINPGNVRQILLDLIQEMN